MARATKRVEKVEKVILVEQATGIDLSLSTEEAQYLYDLLGSVGGLGPIRALNDGICDALYRAGRFNWSSKAPDMESPFSEHPSIWVR